jgi:hypothetical protein
MPCVRYARGYPAIEGFATPMGETMDITLSDIVASPTACARCGRTDSVSPRERTAIAQTKAIRIETYCPELASAVSEPAASSLDAPNCLSAEPSGLGYYAHTSILPEHVPNGLELGPHPVSL